MVRGGGVPPAGRQNAKKLMEAVGLLLAGNPYGRGHRNALLPNSEGIKSIHRVRDVDSGERGWMCLVCYREWTVAGQFRSVGKRCLPTFASS